VWLDPASAVPLARARCGCRQASGLYVMCLVVRRAGSMSPGGGVDTTSTGQGTVCHMEPGEARSGLSQLRRGAVEYCVLALLRDRERYGFELVRELSESAGLVTSEGTIYPLLTRLRKEQLVTTNWRESESGPPRRYYRLTESGHTALATFVKDWARFRDSVDAILNGRKGDAHHGD
jgi:PadR family transcriptional regulator, regulatory protein PadR